MLSISTKCIICNVNSIIFSTLYSKITNCAKFSVRQTKSQFLPLPWLHSKRLYTTDNNSKYNIKINNPDELPPDKNGWKLTDEFMSKDPRLSDWNPELTPEMIEGQQFSSTTNNVDPEFIKKKEKKTPLCDLLRDVVSTRGAISMHTFMNYALVHPEHGYYMKSDVFGKSGDFTTAPEISQLFGELLGAWCAAMYDQLGRPPKLHIIELGPGRGTLASDILNGTKNMKEFFKSIHYHMVEVSPYLRKVQAQKFGIVYPLPAEYSKKFQDQNQRNLKFVASLGLTESANVGQSIPFGPKKTEATLNSSNTQNEDDLAKESLKESIKARQELTLPDVTLKTLPGTPITWHSSFDDIPLVRGEPILIIAQEFFDALPVYHFEFTKEGWRERLVELDYSGNPEWFRPVIASGVTPACSMLRNYMTSSKPSPGDCVEISADGLAIAQSMADAIAEVGGAGLIIDYGYQHSAGITLRAIQDHKFVSPFHSPGDVDLSCMVNFEGIRAAALSPGQGRKKHVDISNLVAYGPIGQGDFLTSLGIDARMAAFLKKVVEEKEAETLISSFHRLTSKAEMGATYKVMGIFSNPKMLPEGFDSDAPVTRPSGAIDTTTRVAGMNL